MTCENILIILRARDHIAFYYCIYSVCIANEEVLCFEANKSEIMLLHIYIQSHATIMTGTTATATTNTEVLD